MTTRGKNGQYVTVPVTEKDASFAFVGCMAEASRSRIIILSLSSPLTATHRLNFPETQCSGIALCRLQIPSKPRSIPASSLFQWVRLHLFLHCVDPKANTGGLDIDDARAPSSRMSHVDARHSNPSNCPIRIRNVQTINNVVYIRCLIMGGPYDVYYMIRPENSVRGDPGDREVMRFGEKVWVEERREV